MAAAGVDRAVPAGQVAPAQMVAAAQVVLTVRPTGAVVRLPDSDPVVPVAAAVALASVGVAACNSIHLPS